MAEITAQMVKQLRERTGAGILECKKALQETGGDMEEAVVVLRKWGLAAAAKKASRSTKQGLIGSYVHAGSQIGVLVEVNCETDFVARTEEFRELVHDIAMQVAAADPKYIRREDAPPEVVEQEREIQRARVLAEGKPAHVADKIVEGRLAKFFEEICLYDQPFIKDNSLTVGDLIKTKIAKIGENITVSRFVRFKVGDSQPEPEAKSQVSVQVPQA